MNYELKITNYKKKEYCEFYENPKNSRSFKQIKQVILSL